jgi:hypothetical protein
MITHPVLTLLGMQYPIDAPHPLRSIDFHCRTCGGYPTLDVRTGRIVRDPECTDHRHDEGFITVHESSAPRKEAS